VFRFFQRFDSVAAVELEAGDGRVVADEVLRDASIAPHHQRKQQGIVQVVNDVVLERDPDLIIKKVFNKLIVNWYD
jgi:hypothetical protein